MPAGPDEEGKNLGSRAWGEFGEARRDDVAEDQHEWGKYEEQDGEK